LSRFRKKKKNTIFNGKNAIGIFVVIMMLASGAGFVLNMNQGGSSSDEYEGQRFVSTQRGQWSTEIDGKNYYFSYHPSVVDYLNISDPIIETMKNADVVYITYNPDDEYITEIENLRFDLESDLDDYFNIIPEIGVMDNTGEYSGFSRIDCQDAGMNAPVLRFMSGEEISFEQAGNCITVYSDDSYGFRLARDRLFYSMLGIIK
jgi:hypothetical protein